MSDEDDALVWAQGFAAAGAVDAAAVQDRSPSGFAVWRCRSGGGTAARPFARASTPRRFTTSCVRKISFPRGSIGFALRIDSEVSWTSPSRDGKIVLLPFVLVQAVT